MVVIWCCSTLFICRDEQFEEDPSKSHWLPMKFYVKVDEEGICAVDKVVCILIHALHIISIIVY